jgi:hypothetical protein
MVPAPGGIASAGVIGGSVGGVAGVSLLIFVVICCVAVRQRRKAQPQPTAAFSALQAPVGRRPDAHGASPSGNYDIVSSSDHYAKHATEFKAGISTQPSYGMLSSAEEGRSTGASSHYDVPMPKPLPATPTPPYDVLTREEAGQAGTARSAKHYAVPNPTSSEPHYAMLSGEESGRM